MGFAARIGSPATTGARLGAGIVLAAALTVSAHAWDGGREGGADVHASRVELKERGIRLSDALRRIERQTENKITDLRVANGEGVTDPRLDLDLHGLPFFDALRTIADKAGVSLTFATGDGSIGVMDGPPNRGRFEQASGPFLVVLRRIELVRDYESKSELESAPATATFQFNAAWEPRLRPMLMAVKGGGLEAVDDQGRAVPPQVGDESTEVVLRPETPFVELRLILAAPDRSARKLSSLKLKAEAAIPADLKTFRFASLAGENLARTIDGVRVVFRRASVEEGAWKIQIEVDYPGGGPAFESYRQGLFNNRIWLQKADGSRIEHNGGFSNTRADGGRYEFEYVFVDVPGDPADYQLGYEAPGKVVMIPFEVRFHDVDLP